MNDQQRDCRTCLYNSYHGLSDPVGWVSCNHPKTLSKMPRWEPGDPQWVAMQTGDVPISRIDDLTHCPTYEVAS
jgi:hypothetical protein